MEVINLSDLSITDKIELIELRIKHQQEIANECNKNRDYESEAVHLKEIDRLEQALGVFKSELLG